MEWIVAIELQKRGIVKAIFPIVMGKQGTDGKFEQFFFEKLLQGQVAGKPLPDIVSKKTTDKAREFLGMLEEPVELSEELSVKKVVETILSFQAVLLHFENDDIDKQTGRVVRQSVMLRDSHGGVPQQVALQHVVSVCAERIAKVVRANQPQAEPEPEAPETLVRNGSDSVNSVLANGLRNTLQKEPPSDLNQSLLGGQRDSKKRRKPCCVRVVLGGVVAFLCWLLWFSCAIEEFGAGAERCDSHPIIVPDAQPEPEPAPEPADCTGAGGAPAHGNRVGCPEIMHSGSTCHPGCEVGYSAGPGDRSCLDGILTDTASCYANPSHCPDTPVANAVTCFLRKDIELSSCPPLSSQSGSADYTLYEFDDSIPPSAWRSHPHTNCYENNGGSLVPGVPEHYCTTGTVEDCQSACMDDSVTHGECTAVVVSSLPAVPEPEPQAADCTSTSGVPAHCGAMCWSGCPDHMRSGTTCQPECDMGYSPHGVRRCTDGILTDTATCQLEPQPEPQPEPTPAPDDPTCADVKCDGGDCAFGNCICSGGFRGVDCSIEPCHYLVAGDQCTCSGPTLDRECHCADKRYAGISCETLVPANCADLPEDYCGDHGRCRNASPTPTCVCDDPRPTDPRSDYWSGEKCDRNMFRGECPTDDRCQDSERVELENCQTWGPRNGGMSSDAVYYSCNAISLSATLACHCAH